MSTSYRRYEILLPRRFNDGRRVPSRLVTETLVELRERFGAASSETQTIRGQWEFRGRVYRDDLVRVFVDVEDTGSNRQYFMGLKERLKLRFQQLDVWLASYPIDLL